jgi:hypothetical protein
LNVHAWEEAHILAALTGGPLPPLRCDSLLNTDKPAGRLVQAPAGGRLLMLFWTPTCLPCKPVLDELVASAATGGNLAYLSVVQSADPDLEPPGEWRSLRVQSLVREHKVSFPTCVHASNELSRTWQAQGVPMLLTLSSDGVVERAAVGAANATRLIRDVTASMEPKAR